MTISGMERIRRLFLGVRAHRRAKVSSASSSVGSLQLRGLVADPGVFDEPPTSQYFWRLTSPGNSKKTTIQTPTETKSPRARQLGPFPGLHTQCGEAVAFSGPQQDRSPIGLCQASQQSDVRPREMRHGSASRLTRATSPVARASIIPPVLWALAPLHRGALQLASRAAPE